MTSRVTGPTRRSRSSLDRDVDETMRRRRWRNMFRRRIRVRVSEVDVLIYFFGIMSLMYFAALLLAELARIID